MKYIISENRLSKLVEKMVHLVEPEFNSEQAGIETTNIGDDSYITYYKKNKNPNRSNRRQVFAKYYFNIRSLDLSTNLFFTLKDYFGEDEMNRVIDWFNEEFNQDAESISY